MMNASDETSAQATTALLVEDDAPMSWRLQDALMKAGYRVRAAGMLADARPRWRKVRRRKVAARWWSRTAAEPAIRGKRERPPG
jgi:hypothetical protein